MKIGQANVFIYAEDRSVICDTYVPHDSFDDMAFSDMPKRALDLVMSDWSNLTGTVKIQHAAENDCITARVVDGVVDWKSVMAGMGAHSHSEHTFNLNPFIKWLVQHETEKAGKSVKDWGFRSGIRDGVLCAFSELADPDMWADYRSGYDIGQAAVVADNRRVRKQDVAV